MQMRPLFRLLLMAGMVAVLGCAEARPGKVILFVGDGMGLAQREAARLAAGGQAGRLAMDQLEELCLVTTHAANALTTDSAAGATAWSAGCKTNNKFLAVGPDSAAVRTILEHARDAGYGTGLVTTTTLTHATPAAFAAHLSDRGAEARIAEQMLATRPQVMLGGGRAFWAHRSQPGSKREDERDLLAEARSAGYEVVQSAAELARLDLSRPRQLLGLFADGHLPYQYDRQDDQVPELAALTRTALEVLDHNERGFFLMVEGGRIDHACHDNDANRAVWEAIAFDQAVAEGIQYARRRNDTLVIAVADHETGGMSVGTACYDGFRQIPRQGAYPEHGLRLDSLLCIGWTTKSHSAIPVVAGALGPGSEHFRGVMDNTELFPIMMETLGLKP
jgi:alkaline phosphatase